MTPSQIVDTVPSILLKTFGIQRCNSLLQGNALTEARVVFEMAPKGFPHERLVSSHQGVVNYHTLNPSTYSHSGDRDSNEMPFTIHEIHHDHCFRCLFF